MDPFTIVDISRDYLASNIPNWLTCALLMIDDFTANGYHEDNKTMVEPTFIVVCDI